MSKKDIILKPLLPASLSTLDQTLAMEEGRPPVRNQMVVLAISMVLLLFMVWASITPIEEIAIANGKIVPSTLVKSVQHLEGGIIETIFVKEGEHVRANQKLLKLDENASVSELEQLRVREASLRIKAERLRSFGMDQEPNFDQFDPRYNKLIEDQKAIYALQVRNRDDQISVIQRQLEQQKALLAIQLGQEQDYRHQLNVVQQHRDLNKSLLSKQLKTKTEYFITEKQLADVQKDLNSVINQTAQTKQSIAEVEQRIVEIKSKLRNEALSEMGNTTSEMSQVTEAILKAEDRYNRLIIRAPSAGIVKGIKEHNLKGVIRPSDEIFQIVPVENLEVEIKIIPKDLGNVKLGQPVKVKISAYDYTRYGMIEGTLKGISATTFLDEEKKPYYRGYVTLSQPYVGKNSRENIVLPGMEASAEIETGEKTLLHFLIKPVYNAISGAFHEA